jgi:branched-chain amino acid transport system substrate-binding protein
MNRGKRLNVFLLVLALATLPLLATSARSASSASKPAATIKVGEICDYSGPARAICGHQRAGFDLAFEHINAAGGIKSLRGAKLEMIHLDHEFKAALAKEQADRLINREKVNAIILGIPSGFGVMVGQMAEAAGIPYYPALVVTPAKTEQGFKNVFSVATTSPMISYAGYQYLDFLTKEYLSKKPTRVALLYADTEYNIEVLKGVNAQATEFGYQVVATVAYPFPPKDLTSFVLRVKAANPDVVMVSPAAGEGPLIDRTMDTLGYDPLRLGLMSAYMDLAYIESMGAKGENSVSIGWYAESMNADAKVFAGKFKARYGYPADSFAAMGYQIARVIGAAIEQAGSAEGKAIVEASRKLNYTKATGPMVLNYQSIRFDPKGQVPRELTGTVGLQVVNGEYVSISPKVSGITFKFKDSWKDWKK